MTLNKKRRTPELIKFNSFEEIEEYFKNGGEIYALHNQIIALEKSGIRGYVSVTFKLFPENKVIVPIDVITNVPGFIVLYEHTTETGENGVVASVICSTRLLLMSLDTLSETAVSDMGISVADVMKAVGDGIGDGHNKEKIVRRKNSRLVKVTNK